MDAGKLKTYVEIHRRTLTADDANEAVPVWKNIGEDWAWVRPLVCRELFLAQSVREDVTHKVTMRWRDDITARDRLVIPEPDNRPSRTLEISTSPVDPDDTNVWIEFMCMEKHEDT